MSCKLQVYISSNGVYADITSLNWAQPVDSFELTYDFIHKYCWKFDLFLKYVTALLLFFKGNLLALVRKLCYQSDVELPDLNVPYIS